MIPAGASTSGPLDTPAVPDPQAEQIPGLECSKTLSSPAQQSSDQPL